MVNSTCEEGSTTVVQQRLPIVSSDDGTWGAILNQYLEKEHYNTGADDAANGGHQHITIRPGGTGAGTAPITLSTGSLMSAIELGAIEFDGVDLYITSDQAGGGALKRRFTLTVDSTTAAPGDIYYLDSVGKAVALPIGSSNQVLTVSGGFPQWSGSSTGVVRSVNAISTATTAGGVANTDYVYNVSGTTTITLPTAVGNTNRYTISNRGVNVVTVATTSSQTINGSLTAAMPIANMSLDFISDGSNWVVQ